MITGKHPKTAEQLQAEMDRMARDTKAPEILRDLFEPSATIPLLSPSAWRDRHWLTVCRFIVAVNY